MGTTFEIMVAGHPDAYCRKATREAFRVLDQLEQELSRFVPNSDISRINSSRPGEPICVGLQTLACIQDAMRLWQLSKGAFDITICGAMDRIGIDTVQVCITRQHASIGLDLGGIGKGFALDQMAEVLAGWGIHTALLHSGASTAIALDGQWLISLTCPFKARQLGSIHLNRAAVSCSSQVARPHVIDPATGTYANKTSTAWVLADTATMADALSTAVLVCGPDKTDWLSDVGVSAFLVARHQDHCQGMAVGPWPGLVTAWCNCPGFD
jgi:thiamine biosynthesis lipoprotein